MDWGRSLVFVDLGFVEFGALALRIEGLPFADIGFSM